MDLASGKLRVCYLSHGHLNEIPMGCDLPIDLPLTWDELRRKVGKDGNEV